jgi:sulfate adenylyltransferase subunit 2
VSYLNDLENEAIHIFREVEAECKKPVLLFSGGKDSAAMLWLAAKAFAPDPIPFQVMHIDTGHNFDETLKFRDALVQQFKVQLIIRKVEDSIKNGLAIEEAGQYPSRNAHQTVTLLNALNEFSIDAAFGGGRRDEEKSRSKERIFSIRNSNGGWDPNNQRPEVWRLYNTKLTQGQSLRVFPLSDWTELDIWLYALQEKMPLPSLYFAHERKVFQKNNILMPTCKYWQPTEGEEVVTRKVRFRTVGDMTCSAVVLSNAETIEEVILENLASRYSERSSRTDDSRGKWAMEDRKRQGYF